MIHSKHDIFISQQKYIINLLCETDKTSCKLASILIDPNLRIGLAEDEAIFDREMH